MRNKNEVTMMEGIEEKVMKIDRLHGDRAEGSKGHTVHNNLEVGAGGDKKIYCIGCGLGPNLVLIYLKEISQEAS